MNSLYWAHVPASTHTQITLKQAKKKNANLTTHELFNLSGDNAFRVTESLGDYSKHLKEFDNWTRLNCLVAVLSYFETYLSSVVSLAIESDLGLIYSIPKRIDGVLVLKYGTNSDYSFYDKSELITKGTWQQRTSNYDKIFGSIPNILNTSVTDLDKMRRIRNNVAHAFGRDIEKSRSRDTLDLLPIERLSQERLQRYMEIIRQISKAIDSHLFEKHIGEYELVHYYSKIKNDLSADNEVQQLKTLINSLHTKNRNHEFCRELILYYKAL